MPLLLIFGVFAVIFMAVSVAVIASRGLLARHPEPSAPASPPQPGQPRFDWNTPVFAPNLLKEETLSSISFWDRILASFDGVETMKSRIAQAGLNWSVGRLTLLMLVSGTASFAVAWKLSWVPATVTLFLCAGATAMPYLVVLRRRARRLRKFEDQFPDAMDSLARALRAGNALAGALDLLARETPQPLGGEFRRVADQRSLGLHWDAALAQLGHRVPIIEVSIFVAAVQLQSRTGGKLHEVLSRLAENMRQASSLKGEVRSIATHGRMTGNLLTALPVGIAIMTFYFNPRSLILLWTDPLGNNLIWLAATGLVAAHFVIAKLVDVKI